MSTRQSQPIAVLGAGSWGTALAIHLARQGQSVRLWGNESEVMVAMRADHSNERYLPGVPFPASLKPVETLAALFEGGVADLLCAIPSEAFRQALQACQPYFSPKLRVVWATKGIDPQSCHLLSDVAREIVGERVPLACLSGPSFAKEVATGLPTAVVVAGKDQPFLEAIVARFHHQAFRVYTSPDWVGVQIGGALKNVYAIAAGISDGLGFGSNARCALITRALAEMMRIGVAIGGAEKTFMGLTGLGDLVLTCTDNQSRNRSFGLAIGQGQSVEQASRSIRQVVEGRVMAEHVGVLAKRYHVEMPIAQMLLDILHQRLPPQKALRTLLSRGAKAEF